MPRLQVSLILSLTALAGFLTSFSLLHLGLSSMWLRYPIATLVAYGVFLILLALWLWLQRRSLDLDPPFVDVNPDVPLGPGESPQFGGGGDFGGGGAGGSWSSNVSTTSSEVSEGGSSSLGFDLDLDVAWPMVVAVVALVGGLVATFYIIYIAPALLAEILIDGALVAGLYRRVKRIEQHHWLRAAIRRTLLPALLVALFLGLAGFALQSAIPEAHTMADVWNQLMRG